MFFLFVTGVGCKTECVGTNELTQALKISVKVNSTIKLNVEETS